MNLAELAGGPRGPRPNRVALHGVDRPPDHPALPVLEFHHGAVEGVSLDVREHHVHAGSGKPLGKGAADSVSGARHNGCPRFELMRGGDRKRKAEALSSYPSSSFRLIRVPVD